MLKEIKLIEQKDVQKKLEKFEKDTAKKRELVDMLDKIELEKSQLSQTKKPNIFTRILRRKTYKEQVLLTKHTLSKLSEELIEKQEELEILNEKLVAEMENLQEERERLNKRSNASSLAELGLTPEEAMSFLLSKNAPVVLEEAERHVAKKGVIKEQSDIVMIRKTDYIPTNDVIKPAKDSLRYEEEITFGGERYKYNYSEGRNTMHFCANHEVTSHSGGSWNKNKYAIIIPFDELEKSKIGSACSVDTFLRGSVELTTGAYILCPKGEREFVRNNNPNINIVEYEGDSVSGYAELLISALGYPVVSGNAKCLNDSESQRQYDVIMQEQGLQTLPHCDTTEGLTEDEDTELNKFVSILKLIQDKRILDKISITELVEEMKEQKCFELLSSISTVNAETGELDYRFNVMFEKLQSEGIYLSEDSMTEIVTKGGAIGITLLKKKLIDFLVEDNAISKKENGGHIR